MPISPDCLQTGSGCAIQEAKNTGESLLQQLGNVRSTPASSFDGGQEGREAAISRLQDALNQNSQRISSFSPCASFCQFWQVP